MTDDLLGAAAPKVATDAMMIDEADREVRVRKQVYPRRVPLKMTQARADYQIWVMGEIKERLRAAARERAALRALVFEIERSFSEGLDEGRMLQALAEAKALLP